MGSPKPLASGHGHRGALIGGGPGRETLEFLTRAETLTTLSLSPQHHSRNPLQLQEQAALETEEGEGLQQTLRDMAQVGARPALVGAWAGPGQVVLDLLLLLGGLELNCELLRALEPPCCLIPLLLANSSAQTLPGEEALPIPCPSEKGCVVSSQYMEGVLWAEGCDREAFWEGA